MNGETRGTAENARKTRPMQMTEAKVGQGRWKVTKINVVIHLYFKSQISLVLCDDFCVLKFKLNSTGKSLFWLPAL